MVFCLLQVDDRSDPELFWGLRGAGAFLSVVTLFTLRLHPVPSLLPSLSVTFPLNVSERVGRFFRDFVQSSCRLIEPAMLYVLSPSAPHAHSLMLSCLAFSDRTAEVESCFEKV